MSLTQPVIINAAMNLLNRFGLADLSMRRIADELGVQAPTIYWHFANKQTLLAAVADEIIRHTPVTSSIDEWAWGLRVRLHRFRDGAELVSSALASGLCTHDPTDDLASSLVAGGINSTDAGHVARAVLHFVLGHVYAEQTRASMVEFAGAEMTVDDTEGFEVGIQLFTRAIEGLTRE